MVKELRVDCDGDAVLLKVEQQGDAACHTGKSKLLLQPALEDDGSWQDDGVQVFDPDEVYGK